MIKSKKININEQQNLPCVCFQEALETPFFDQQMLWMNVKLEANLKMAHQIDKKQLTYQVGCGFLTLPVMQPYYIRITSFSQRKKKYMNDQFERTYRQKDKYGTLTASFINMTYEVFKKIIINNIFIQSFLGKRLHNDCVIETVS